MRAILGRGGAGSLLLLVCFCLLQAGDSAISTVTVAASTAASTSAAAPLTALVLSQTTSGRRITVSRHEFVPVGRSVINMPILMYHYVQTIPMYPDRLGYNLSVSPANFDAQMSWLAANGYNPVDFNDVRAYFGSLRPLPSRPVIITLDDGYRDLYTTAFPILKAHRFKAVAYIVSSFVGQSRYVSAAQVLEMDREGIQIASHTVNHADLARSSSPQVMHQLMDSKAWLEQLLGHPVLDFAYPSGKFTAQVAAEVRLAGYESAVTEQQSAPHSLADRFTWGRVRVGGGESLSDFIRNVGPVESSMAIVQFDREPITVDMEMLRRPYPLRMSA